MSIKAMVARSTLVQILAGPKATWTAITMDAHADTSSPVTFQQGLLDVELPLLSSTALMKTKSLQVPGEQVARPGD